MAKILFVTPQEITNTTILGGNVDRDKYLPCVEMAQIFTIEPLLGTELYDLILDGVRNDTLSGVYLTIFEEYVKDITKYSALGEYIVQSQYELTNAGLFKNQPENAEIVDVSEVVSLSQKYRSMADSYIQRFNKFICKNNVPEYKRYQDEVNAQNIQKTIGWHLGGSTYRNEDDLW